ncbi:MAG: hypothetical protein CMJ18_07465 [Phycisphaeraceae bacterium]|nr:hypothetical protein [Phycisphaeraceae bacterium]
MTNEDSIELTAVEPGGTDRVGFPLTVGIPFARGVLGPGEPVAILDSGGAARPVQARPLEAHDDRSVRWLLLDYQSDFTAFAPSTCRLVIGRESPEPTAGRRIETRDHDERLVMDNGVIELEMDRARCRPLLRLGRGGATVGEGGLDFRLIDTEGREFCACHDSDCSFEIEESGPMRWLVRWEGTHRSEDGQGHFDFLVRVTVYAGQPFVRVDHTFFNRLDPDITSIGRLAARLPFRLGSDLRYTVADVYRRPTTFETDEPARLEQYAAGHFRIVAKDGRVLREVRNNSMGWISAGGSDQGVMLAGRNFWQNYPKAIAADSDGIGCDLIPDRGDPFAIPRGMARTHTFFLSFHDGTADATRLVDMAYSMQRWPMPAAPSAYYQQSGQLWDFFAYHPRSYPRLESALRKFYESDSHHWLYEPRDKLAGKAYGLKHYGDYFQARTNTPPEPDDPRAYYHNNEYDVPHVLAVMFLRSREIVKWWGAEAHALHMMDVDTCHHAVEDGRYDHSGPFWLRDGQYRHCYQHVGGIQTPEDPEHISAGGSHTFGEGLVDLYHLTGDRRYFDVARGYARNLARTINHYEPVGVGRIAGWALLVMGAVQMAEPDDDVAREANVMIDRIISQQQGEGGILEANFHVRAFEDRKIHLCMRGLIKWHQATNCDKTKKLILDLMEAYLDMGLLDEGMPLYSTWPEHSKPTTPSQGFANLESLAYAYDLGGDRRFIDAGIPALCDCVQWLNQPETIKGFDHFERVLRGPWRFMAIAHDLGLLARVPGAGEWLLPT